MEKLTQRQRDALIALGDREMSPAEFARVFWPGKEFARGNGPWGLGPDASGRHGGRMLTALKRLGLVRHIDHDGYYTARLTEAGLNLLDKIRQEPSDDR